MRLKNYTFVLFDNGWSRHTKQKKTFSSDRCLQNKQIFFHEIELYKTNKYFVLYLLRSKNYIDNWMEDHTIYMNTY